MTIGDDLDTLAAELLDALAARAETRELMQRAGLTPPDDSDRVQRARALLAEIRDLRASMSSCAPAMIH